MSATKRIMTARRDGQPGSEYRDFLVVDSLYGDDARLYLPGEDAPLAPGDNGRWLVWRDADGAEHRDLITCAAFSPSGGWNTSVEQAAVKFLRERDVLVRGWNA